MPAQKLYTGRLVLAPFGWQDAAELAAFRADPRVWAMMLGGVRTPAQSAADLAAEIAFWGAHGVGMWTARDLDGTLLGVTGLHERPDAHGIALRYAFDPAVRGNGLAREAAGAALRDAHERAGLTRVVAVTRETNFSSRKVLGGIGMVEAGSFNQHGHAMSLYESIRPHPG